MLTLFCDCKGVVMMEWLQPKQTIDSEQYIKTLAKLKECIRQKRPQMWKDKSFLIHHDNASPHSSFMTQQKINKWGLTQLPHPPNSPDIAPCDYGFFPKLKAALRGRRFQTVKQLQQEVRRILLSWKPQVFNDILHEMVGRWQKVCAADGHYFEGDNISIDPLFVRDPDTDSDSDSDD